MYINALAWLSRQYFCWIQIGTAWKKYIGSDINRFAYLGFVMLFLCWRWLFCFRYLQVIPCTGLGGDCAVWSIKVWWIVHPHKKYAGSVSSCCLQTCFIQFPDRSHLDQLDAPQWPPAKRQPLRHLPSWKPPNVKEHKWFSSSCWPFQLENNRRKWYFFAGNQKIGRTSFRAMWPLTPL